VRGVLAPSLIIGSLTVLGLFQPDFFDFPSLALTLGGSIVVVMFSYSPAQLREIVASTRALLTESPVDPSDFVDELARLAQLYRAEGLRGLERVERSLTDGFLSRGVGMLIDLQKEQAISDALRRDFSDALRRHELARQMFLLLNRIFPAFGLIGTLIGMVLLLRNLYTHDVQSLPAALSLAVLTTLYGAVFANVFVAPVGARLNAAAAVKEARMQATIGWVLSLARNEMVLSELQNPKRHRYLPRRLLISDTREWALLPASSH
jgi:chemotaxis protein MotA